VLRAVHDGASSLKLPYFVAGAIARDILLTHVFGLPTYRATRDIDFAVAVPDWAGFETFKGHLLQRAGFEVDRQMLHRLRRQESVVDLIPFGGVESEGKRVAWPPDLSTILNVAGHDDALAAAETVQVTEVDALRIPVVSLPGLAMLKLFAWADRGQENSKDAVDFATLLRQYANAGNQDRLYGDSFDVMEAVDHQLPLAGARLLGRDTRQVMSRDTYDALRRLLDDRVPRERLVIHMARRDLGDEDVLEEADAMLSQFERGLEEETA